MEDSVIAPPPTFCARHGQVTYSGWYVEDPSGRRYNIYEFCANCFGEWLAQQFPAKTERSGPDGQEGVPGGAGWL